jgi:hypothetical protein
MYDAAFPPAAPYPGCGAVAGYIGGNTPHVWTLNEWNLASSGGQLPQLPIWVGYEETDPVGHAKEAAAAATGLGWAPFHGPKDGSTWRAIVADVEDVAETAWLTAFGTALRAEGYLCWPYMSADVLSSDPPGYQVWLARWDGQASVPAIHNVVAHQFAHDLPWRSTTVDVSAVLPGALAHFGHGIRR